MHAEAHERVMDVSLRIRLLSQLEGATEEAVRLNRALMNENTVTPRVRSSIAKHFMDRMLFNRDTDEQEYSYRDILRQLDEVRRQLGKGVYLLSPEAISEANEGDNGDPGAV